MRITQGDDAVELALSGEFDLSRAPTVKEELSRALERLAQTGDTPTRMVLDLRELTFIDSSGIQVLVAARRRCLQQGIDLSLRVGGSQVRRVLSLAGVAEYLGVE